jgi:peptidoglycan/LPS O-acetylase OafA/YrhL
LGVEEQYYILWPWIILLFLHFGKIKWMKWILPLFILISWIFNETGIYPVWLSSILKEPIIIGSAGAILLKFGHFRKLPSFVAWISLLLILIAGIFPIDLPDYKFNLAAVLTIFLIVSIVVQPTFIVSQILQHPWLVFIGKISYSLYLWHVPVFRWFAWHVKLPGNLAFPMKFIVTFFVAIASWYLIEKRATALGRKWSAYLLRPSSN